MVTLELALEPLLGLGAARPDNTRAAAAVEVHHVARVEKHALPPAQQRRPLGVVALLAAVRVRVS